MGPRAQSLSGCPCEGVETITSTQMSPSCPLVSCRPGATMHGRAFRVAFGSGLQISSPVLPHGQRNWCGWQGWGVVRSLRVLEDCVSGQKGDLSSRHQSAERPGDSCRALRGCIIGCPRAMGLDRLGAPERGKHGSPSLIPPTREDPAQI